MYSERGTESVRGLEHQSDEEHLKEAEGAQCGEKEAQGGSSYSLQLPDRIVQPSEHQPLLPDNK